MSTMTKPEKKRSKFSKWMRGELDSQKFTAVFGPSLSESAILGGHELKLSNPAGKAQPFKPYIIHNTKGLHATVKDGAQMNSYVSKGAVGGGVLVGAVLLGPIGALAGGLIGSSKRKGGNEINVVIERGDELVAVISAPVAKVSDANNFAERLNASAADAELTE
ncbi:hypothetical protein [Glutamicibacter sp. AOP5-A2-18]|uniref:hypothetical protein n=1 Tax=Glutamicibacter sp. AOP5-A2-18 TaxID=3457656 RepID=UPI004033DD62